MNRKIKVIILIIIVMTMVIIGNLHLYTISKDSNLLTKNEDFGIINNIENIIMTCMSTNGEKTLSTKSKMDAITIYILNNREIYKDKLQYKEDKYYIDAYEYINIYNLFFDDEKLNLNNPVNLEYKDVNYFSFDNCMTLKTVKQNDLYNIYNKYERELNGVENDVYVKFILNREKKIENVIIIESII